MTLVREILKRGAETFLVRLLQPWLSERGLGKVAVLAYHNIVPEGQRPGGDRSLHLTQSDFAAQLDILRETHRVVGLSEVVDVVRAGHVDGGDRPLAALTFDDAYRGAMTCGLEELSARDLPATVFVSPGRLGDDGFWWDRVAWPEHTEVVPAGEGPDRGGLLDEAGGRQKDILDRGHREGWLLERIPPEHARPIEEAELRSVAQTSGITIGAHGWSHANLVAVSSESRREELERPLVRLGEIAGEALCPVLAYPYGCWNPETERAVEAAGYEAAFRVRGGLLNPGDRSPYRLPRINIPAGASREGFFLRAVGVID